MIKLGNGSCMYIKYIGCSTYVLPSTYTSIKLNYILHVPNITKKTYQCDEGLSCFLLELWIWWSYL